jgi:hypothetical protein
MNGECGEVAYGKSGGAMYERDGASYGKCCEAACGECGTELQ